MQNLLNYQTEIKILKSDANISNYENVLDRVKLRLQSINMTRNLLIVKEILRIIDDNVTNNTFFPNVIIWQKKLPSILTKKFVPEMTEKEAAKWLDNWKSMSIQKKIEEEKKRKWSLSNWIYWFEPDNKKWFWLNDEKISEDEFILELVVTEIPTPKDALIYLFKLFNIDVIEL